MPFACVFFCPNMIFSKFLWHGFPLTSVEKLVICSTLQQKKIKEIRKHKQKKPTRQSSAKKGKTPVTALTKSENYVKCWWGKMEEPEQELALFLLNYWLETVLFEWKNCEETFYFNTYYINTLQSWLESVIFVDGNLRFSSTSIMLIHRISQASIYCTCFH